MSRSDHLIADVINAIFGYLERHRSERPAIGLLVERCRAARPGVVTVSDRRRPVHESALESTLAELAASDSEQLAAVGQATAPAARSLAWQVDHGLYYEGGAPISESYRHGNMHAVLAEGDDMAMGLFLLASRVDYLDHRHRAPELYLNLTGPTQWRFDLGEWQTMPAGSVVWNEPGRVHATRTGAMPWLSFWAWLSDIDHPCEVVG